MITLNKEDVKAAARKAYHENRLQGQHHEEKPPAGKLCFYRTPMGYCCGIGAALPDDVAKTFDALDDTSIITLINAKKVVTDDEDYLCALQRAHDNIVSTWEKSEQDEAWTTFKDLLDID
jgi:hypothetical protein